MKKNILIICQDYIGKTMAGPAIRSWEFATQLSKNHNVVVVSHIKPEIKSKLFNLKICNNKGLKEEIKKADIVITQKITPKIANSAKAFNTRIILDAYDPITVEALEANSHEPIKLRKLVNSILLTEQSSAFMLADSIICASEKQRDFWIGVLSSVNRITPEVYDSDNSLRELIDVVPFGLSSKPATISTPLVLRKKFGLSEEDFVLLWGGGIWNWFDPLTLIEAVAKLQGKVPVKLVFMGIDHPNVNIPRMPMVEKAIQKAKKLGLLDKSVFFNEGWVPYEERQGYLLDADAGVSMHYDHLETRFSFRTRILDYIWAGLPIIATQGDSFAEVIEEHKLGEVVRYNDSGSIAQAIQTLASDKALRQQIKGNIRSIQKRYYWQECVKPIENMIAYWDGRAPEIKPNINQTIFYLTGIYGNRLTLSKKAIKKYLRPRQNLNRLIALYSSQDVIRLKRIKKLLGRR